MKIDLHNHTRDGSIDAVTDPDLLVEVARARGLDGVCITEHGKARTPLAEALRKRHGFLVLSGMEVSTELGDLLVFGVDAIPRALITARQVCDFVRANGGVVVAAHPYRWDLSPKPWIGPRDPDLTIEKALAAPLVGLVDAMEAANGWATALDVDFTREVARRAGLGVTGGSDAHGPNEVGRCFTVFEDAIRDEASLVRALKSGRFQAEDHRPEHERGPVKYYLRDFS
ncbi:MAG TPA: CehA/McbA family metallohydrolase [Dehalococcoidia bacterium]|jgi:predicted metal-dependent phosphoesterase TrpH|nr:CehA/McbA family metallohydrolase [Dehalococcoidia bacterium]